MIEYPDRSFSNEMPLEDAFKTFQEHIDNNIPVRALHVGTPYELAEIRRGPEIEKRLKALEAAFESIETEPKSKIIHIPTKAEVQAFIRNDSPINFEVTQAGRKEG